MAFLITVSVSTLQAFIKDISVCQILFGVCFQLKGLILRLIVHHEIQHENIATERCVFFQYSVPLFNMSSLFFFKNFTVIISDFEWMFRLTIWGYDRRRGNYIYKKSPIFPYCWSRKYSGYFKKISYPVIWILLMLFFSQDNYKLNHNHACLPLTVIKHRFCRYL